MEGGLQYSSAYDNYSAYIRVDGGSLIFDDDPSTPQIPKRFKSNTSFVHNLRYEPANLKIKYYANGTNTDNVFQSLIFSYSKSFTSTQQSKLRVRRLTALAYSGYNGTQSLGKIDVQYNNSTFLTSNNTLVNCNTSLLDTWINNNKIYGTVDWPVEKVTKSPSTGDISNQRQILNTI